MERTSNQAESLTFNCKLNCSFEEVARGFNKDLFQALCPAFPRIRIKRFDGIRIGNQIHLIMDFIFFKWPWNGFIISCEETNQELIFVDSGEILPPFLSFWKHSHEIRKTDSGCVITDYIEFRPARIWPAFLVKWMIWLQMRPRAFIYRSYFEK